MSTDRHHDRDFIQIERLSTYYYTLFATEEKKNQNFSGELGAQNSASSAQPLLGAAVIDGRHLRIFVDDARANTDYDEKEKKRTKDVMRVEAAVRMKSGV